VRYLIVAEAYRDLEQLSSRLALTERLAELLAQTPAGLLPTVCYLCQGLIAPEFDGVDLGLAGESSPSARWRPRRARPAAEVAALGAGGRRPGAGRGAAACGRRRCWRVRTGQPGGGPM